MGYKKKIFWRLILPLVIWSIIAVVALATPLPQEPEGLPPETWSYYSGQSPQMNAVFKHRNEILVIIFALAMVPELFFLFFERKKDEKK